LRRFLWQLPSGKARAATSDSSKDSTRLPRQKLFTTALGAEMREEKQSWDKGGWEF